MTALRETKCGIFFTWNINKNNFQLDLLFIYILDYNFYDLYRLKTIIRNRLVFWLLDW
jgi:hypothetical protein